MRKSKGILEEVMEFEKIKKIISEVLNVDVDISCPKVCISHFP